VQFQWLHEGRAYCITLTSSNREAIDVYIEANLAALRQWPKDQRYFSLQDTSHPSVGITPYFRTRLEEVLAAMTQHALTGHSVVVLSNSIGGNLLRIYGRIFARKAGPMKQHWVVGLAAAQATLAQLLAEEG
jgi:hypothetical protein